MTLRTTDIPRQPTITHFILLLARVCKGALRTASLLSCIPESKVTLSGGSEATEDQDIYPQDH